ncbi:MAG TPA: hypothetical protein VGU20_05505 [Stellaceae bacterium]|nr:hypothetical protein [Stellaceae bacterium]
MKMVVLNDTPIGEARTWIEVAQLVSAALKRMVTPREALGHGSEGRDGFHVNLLP